MLRLDRLKQAYANGYVVPIMRRLSAAPGPRQIYRALADHNPSVLLETPVAFSNVSANRYSYVAWDPLSTLSIRGLRGETCMRSGERYYREAQAIRQVRDLLGSFKGMMWPEIDFFTGGAVGCFAYELAHQFETLPLPYRDLGAQPDVLLAVYDHIVAYDHKDGSAVFIENIVPQEAVSFETAHRAAEEKLVSAMNRVLHHSRGVIRGVNPAAEELHGETSRETFCRNVSRIKEYIRSGDVYQVNLSQRFGFEYSGDPFLLYERLQEINPSPFSAYLHWGPWHVISSSPERLARLDGDRLDTRPIAGTRPRGRDDGERDRLRSEMLLSEKERAEHLMLVDLERNDLGKVCRHGSVTVDEWMTVEAYSHVQHIVSNVSGVLRSDRDRFDVLQALFPGGTITGCPKIRCMEIIHELEKSDRGFYTGSLGYFDFGGRMDLNILIRTLVLNGRFGTFQVGAGIVADSDAAFEYRETLHKAEALLKALGSRTVPLTQEPGARYAHSPV